MPHNISKYQFGGEDPYSTNFFNSVSSYLKTQQEQQQTSDYEAADPTVNEADTIDQEVDDSAYTDDDYNGLLEQYNDLSSEYEKLKSAQSMFQDSGDPFLSFLFEDTKNLPLTFSQEELDPGYYQRAVSSQPNTLQTGIYQTPANSLDPDKYLSAIYGNEGGKTGVDPAIRGKASGRFGLMPVARQEVYNAHFKDRMSFKEFEKQYNTSANFEYEVARKLAESKIRNSKTVAEAFGSWYSPAHANSGQFNVVPRPDYGNRITVGQYAEKAARKYKQYGGPVANTAEELYNGLNNSDLEEMLLNLPQQYNMIRGLDNGQPVKIQDELGNEDVLYGPDDMKEMYGKVYEQKIQKKKNEKS